MSSIRGRWVLAAVAVLGMAGGAFAVDRRVPGPFDSIQEAVDAANAGDRIVLGRQVFNEAVVVTGKNNLSFVGQGAVWESVDPMGNGTCLTATGDGISVTGIRFRHGDDHIFITGNNAKVTNCVSRQAGDEFVEIVGNNARVENCRAVGPGDEAVNIQGTDATVSRNIFAQTDNDAVVIDGSGATCERNTIILPGGDGFDITGADATVSRNRFNAVDDTVIDISGDRAVVQRNRAQVCDLGIYISGNFAKVESNRITLTGDDGAIEIDGTDAKVKRNRIAFVNSGNGVEVTGDRGEIVSNRIQSCFADDAIEAIGDDMEVARNRINEISDDSDGIYVVGVSIGESEQPSDNSTIERNILKDISEDGLYLIIQNSTVRKNVLVRCGSEDDAGIEVRGDGNRIEFNTVSEADDDGFEIDGNMNELFNNTARDCYEDGFDIESGTGNVLRGCKAFSCDGEGLDNSATDTEVTGCILLGNRIDLANEGTFSNDVDNANRFNTGSAATLPEVD